MRRDTMTQAKIIDLTGEILRGFYGRSIDHLTHYLSDDFVWIGAYDFQFTTSKQQFLDVIQSELNSIQFQMYDEEYEFLSRDRDMMVLYCRFKLRAPLSDHTFMQTHTRLTVIWRYVDSTLKLIHIHGSNAQDIPLSSETLVAIPEPNNFIDYITQPVLTNPPPKKMFRTSTGEFRVLMEYDILYIEAQGQNSLIHTRDETILVSGLLRVHQDSLSDIFFRIHKSYLVNSGYITALLRYQVTLCNQILLPVGKERYLVLKQFIETSSS